MSKLAGRAGQRFLCSQTQAKAVSSPLHFGNHGDGSGEDGNGIDLHNTWRFMKHIHTYYNMSLDPGKQVTQSKDNPCQGKLYKRELACFAYVDRCQNLLRNPTRQQLNSDSFHLGSEREIAGIPFTQ